MTPSSALLAAIEELRKREEHFRADEKVFAERARISIEEARCWLAWEKSKEATR